MTNALARAVRPPSARWGVPVGIAALVIGGSIVGPAVAASAGTDLPDRTAAELLTDLQGAELTALSGTVLVGADLGLPSLGLAGAGMSGGPGGGSGTDLLSMLGGSTTVRVWASGPRARIAVHGDGGERDIVSDGTQVWLWSSDDLSVTHAVLPGRGSDSTRRLGDGSSPVGPEQVLTPEVLSKLVLDLASPTTTVTTGPVVTVAGRPAHELVLTPAEPGSLVSQVRIAVDAAERVPTRVQVFSTSSAEPALSVGFTSVSFAAPDDGVFAFTPPAGATVTEQTWDESTGFASALSGDSRRGGTAPLGSDAPTGTAQPRVVGSGWASVLIVPGSDSDPLAPTGTTQDESGASDLSATIALLPEVSGDWGSGRLLSSALVSVLLLDDGTLLVGAVGGDTLQTVAATLG